MVTVVPKDNDWSDVFQSLGSGLSQGYMNRSDDLALQKSLQGLDPNASPRQILDAITNTKTYSPQAKQNVLKNYLGVAEFEELKRKNKAQEEINRDKNEISSNKQQSPEEKQKSINNFLLQGFNQEEAEALNNPYVPNSVKQGISKRVEDELARGIRKPKENAPVETNPQEATSPQPEIVNNAVEQNTQPPMQQKETPKNQEWPKLPVPEGMKPSELVKWRTDNQKFNSKELKDLRSKQQSNQDALIHYSRLQQLNDTGKVQDGVSRLMLDPETGEPYRNVQKIAGVNKETQQYVKTLNDFISQAKNFFGSRVTNFDLQSFKSRLPSLLNTEEGRRAILEQMRLLTELQSIHDKELAEGIKSNGDKSYIDIAKTADERITEKEQSIINKINHLDTATKWLDRMATNPKYKDLELMFNPTDNEFIAVRPGDINAVKKKGYELWRTSL